MRKTLITATLLLAFLAGCNQEKVEITTYLGELEASNQKMKDIGQEMRDSMAGLQQKMASGDFDPEVVKGQIQVFVDRMKAEKEKIDALKPPVKAQGLHDATVKHYQAAIDVLNETGPMLDIAAKMTAAGKRIEADPKVTEKVMAEIKPVQEELMKLQQKVGEMARQGQEFEKQAAEEQKKLQDEFGIPSKEGATATPMPPAEGSDQGSVAPPTDGSSAAPATPQPGQTGQ